MPQSRQKKHVSPKQLRANRLNAQRSTGPRTEEGKARSAMNAVGHGIFCRDLLMPGEDPAELETFGRELLAGLEPRDALERSIAEQYVEARWRIRRIRGAERDAHELLAAEIEVFDGNVFATVRSRLRDLPRLESMRLTDADPRPQNDPLTRERLREQRYADRRALVPVSATMALSFHRDDRGSFERLSRYQQRLELSADRALRQLRQLRKERGANWVPPATTQEPIAAPSGVVASATTPRADEERPAQNEPISETTPASDGASDTCETSACNDSRGMSPEIFHPIPVGSRNGVAEATPPLGTHERR